MTVTVLVLIVGVLHGVITGGAISMLMGRRILRSDGSVKRKRGIVRMTLASNAIALSLALCGGEFCWISAAQQFDRIDRVQVDVNGANGLHGSERATNFLLVGTDNRPGQAGNRSDTMLILRVGDGKAKMLSIPRDLRVALPSQGGRVTRINAAYNDGPTALLSAVQESLGIPIDRYIEINFVSFGGLVDALGGVTINFPNPAVDTHSGLNVQQAGDVRLNGEQALAYVRSRYYHEVIDGEVQPSSGLGDLDRVKRQQIFLKAVLKETAHAKNPFEMLKLSEALSSGLKIDNHMELTDALAFAWQMGRLNPEQVTLPVKFIPGSGEVDLADGASEVIAQFG